MLRTILAVLLAGTLLRAEEPPASPAPVPDTPQPPAAEPSIPATPVAPPSSPETSPPSKPAASSIAIEIDLAAQKAWVLQEGKRVYETPISSGRTGHETPSGNFSVLEKDPNHKSSLYGKIIDDKGRVIRSDADCATPVPPGAKFEQAPMRNFLRFDGAVGMHAGRLPGHPASHGCVRLPASKAALFFNIAEVGTPVRVFGKAPRTGTEPTHPEIVNAPASASTPAPPAPSPVAAESKPRGFLWFLKR